MASSTKIWHYTNWDSLQNILATEFLLPSNRGEERYDFIDPNISIDYKKVCLTNMSTDDNRIHKRKYGDYFIGFENHWVDHNQICPIIYCREKGKLTELLIRITNKISREDRDELLTYIKPYSDFESDQYHGPQGDMENLRRYDEHEWRYIAKHDNDVLKFTPNDVFRIYVQTDDEKKILQQNFPKYANKIHSLMTDTITEQA